MKTAVVAAILLLSFALPVANSATVDVYPQNCTEKRRDNNVTLNAVINGAVQSHTVYQLLAGNHCIFNFSYVQNMSNLTFIGDSSRPERVNVTCVARAGLAFINISTLTLEGLTIDGCGVTSEDNLQLFQWSMENNIDFFYDLYYSTDVIAVLVGLVADFTVRSVTINATKGLGMLVVNPQRATLVEDSIFSSNHPLSCYRLPLDDSTSVNLTENNHIGGGAFFVYLNFMTSKNTTTSLEIRNNSFLNNSYCGLEAKVALNYRLTKLASKLGYSLGAGGGLSIVLAQTLYPTQVVVDSCKFLNNTSYFGGGAHVAMFDGVSGNEITFYNCSFLKNGLAGNIVADYQFYTSGAALYIVKDLIFPSDHQEHILVSPAQNNTVLVQNCSMIGNRATSAGAVYIYSMYSPFVNDIVIFDNCTLSENEGLVGAALYIGEQKNNGLQPGIEVTFRNMIVTKNRILFEESAGNIATSSKSDSSAAIELQAIRIIFEGINTLISNNYASAIRSVASVIYIHDHMVLCNNSGSFGGGMHLLSSSYIVLKNNSHLRLENNTGAVEGGAVYVNLLGYSLDFNYHDCFLFFEEVETLCFGNDSCSNVTSLNFMLELIDNSSPLGSLIFGSTLDTCPWSYQLKKEFDQPPSYPVLDIMYEMTDKFNFSTHPTTVSAVTTPSTKLVIHDLQLTTRNHAPGELFYLNVSGYDHLNQSTPVLLASKPSTSIDNVSSILGFSNFSFLDHLYGDSVPVIIAGRLNVTNITIYLYATDSNAQTAFHVNLTECAVGFEYHNGHCQCESGLSDHSGIKCNQTSMELTVSNNHWAGPGPTESLIISSCISDFCSTGERKVKPPDFNALCHTKYNRSGILCGGCVKGLSMTLGSHRCKKCSDHSVSLIILFAIAGIVIMFGISFLRITVSDGYLNSILFFTNVLSIYIPIFVSSTQSAALFVIVEWFNLNFGIEQCFYDGMTTLTHVALRLVFPLYLVLLMVLITVISKKSTKLAQVFSSAQFSAAKLFATVLLMSYATLLEACLELLSPVILTSVDGERYIMWRSDPNQRYLHDRHIPLVIVACTLLFTVILPAPILLMFPRIAFSTRFGVRLKPILDAFWAPFKTKFRFFVGLRLLLRIIPFATAYLIHQPMNILILGIFSVSTFFFQVVIQPFRGFWQNTLEYFFLTNTVMLVLGALYFEIFITAYQENQGFVKYHHEQDAYFTLFVTIAYVAFLAVILWHVQHRFPIIRDTLVSLVSRIRTREPKRLSADVSETTPIMQIQANSDSVLLEEDPWPLTESQTARQTGADTTTSDKTQPPPPVNYSILREPLLEEGVADLVPVTS